jgi:hypothetical protein
LKIGITARADQHTLLDAVADPGIARPIAPYLWAPDPGPSPDPEDGRSSRRINAGGSRAGLGFLGWGPTAN